MLSVYSVPCFSEAVVFLKFDLSKHRASLERLTGGPSVLENMVTQAKSTWRKYIMKIIISYQCNAFETIV